MTGGDYRLSPALRPPDDRHESARNRQLTSYRRFIAHSPFDSCSEQLITYGEELIARATTLSSLDGSSGRRYAKRPPVAGEIHTS